MDEKQRERERLRQPAAKFILAWWRWQLLNNRLNLSKNRDQDKLYCRMFIARLILIRSCQDFRRSRYGANNENHIQLRQELHRVLQYLEIIDAKLNVTHRLHHE
jgi:hypothetical protein